MSDPAQPRLSTRLFKPYSGEPPPGLYRSSPDFLIRLAGMAVPHFMSAVMRLGGDQELPELPLAVNRKAMVVVDRRRVAQDEDVVQLTLVAPDGTKLPEWHAGGTSTFTSPPDARGSTRCAGIRARSGSIGLRCGGSPAAVAGLLRCMVWSWVRSSRSASRGTPS